MNTEPMEVFNSPAGALPPDLLLLLTAAILVSALGFFRTVWFVSIGYGFSVSLQAILILAVHGRHADAAAIVQIALLAVYGIRLGGYITWRDRSGAYGREAAEVSGRGSGIGVTRKLAIWFGVALLYVMMASPALYRARSVIDGRATVVPAAWAGVAVMILGLVIEAVADLQKARYKRTHPDRFCDSGLYRFVRCPNYLGEILFWTGGLIGGAASLRGWLPWILSVIAWICITLIMLGSTKRLEFKQEQRYGEREDFRSWCRRTPVLIPFVPVYSLKNIRVYLE